MSMLKRRRYNIGYLHYDDQAAITPTFTECTDGLASTLFGEKLERYHYRVTGRHVPPSRQ